MKNTTRNSLVLGGLLAAVLATGIGVSQQYSKKGDSLEERNLVLSGEIKQLDYQLAMIDSLRDQFDIQMMATQQSKLILAEDNPTITYRYLLKILGWMGKSLVFDFASSDKGGAAANWHEYVISGRGAYSDLINLAANLEHQRTILTIEELVVSADAQAVGDTVSYSMILRTHYKEGGSDPDQVSKADIPAQYMGYNPFRKRIHETPPDMEYDPRLLRLESATLIGITDYRAFVRDADRVIKILSLGDRVAGGYLYAIHPGEGKAVFKVNTYGVWEERIMYVIQPN